MAGPRFTKEQLYALRVVNNINQDVVMREAIDGLLDHIAYLSGAEYTGLIVKETIKQWEELS